VIYHDGMIRSTAPARDDAPPRPVDESYWLLPGRLLVGAHPGSRSRAQAMDRLRRFLEAGVTCFIDLTEPEETPSYEALLPFATPTGRRVEYLREPIVDHGVPANRETMARILAMLDGALESGHTVYLHCRAGIGRSAMAAACWLGERGGNGEQALAELARCWPQAAQSRHWPRIPETDEQVQFVLDWVPGRADAADRLRGAWYGLALGDALVAVQAHGEAPAADARLAWTQHTALALCLADSLLAKGKSDARDQIERYVRWQREGHRSATGEPGEAIVTPDVAKALATYLWRGQPMAGSHDPRDGSPTSLPRVLAAASFMLSDPPAAVALGAECSRTTHQSPSILEACRLYAAILVGALLGEPPPRWLEGVPDFERSPWAVKALRADVRAAASAVSIPPPATGGVLHVLLESRRIVHQTPDFEAAVKAARRAGKDLSAPHGALVGALFGALHGFRALPEDARARLAGTSQLDEVLERLIAHGRITRGIA
jgi:ADP-ribosylglycohydrolase/protein-tyrosine phosphatase